ncbi:MAG: Two-component transcriptional response regulator, winged helix family [uncultured Pyrinomonadaceae bacterium]|uniref:Two-component transcriptional response regulator, winged helix family n=1 Tax=uncultured Pyrinomonadaceae bacterium TaxID=2283094 RepID=A0A6J4P2R5_9BACT|nr:MAG: Two-component transcriptional response regulator, winged helix family [uncultured Pyrinomonadaceae bacterium]
MKILIVEDEQHIADGLRFNLEAEGFETELAGDGKIALDILTANGSRFDAIVLDVMMPEVDGFTVAKRLRETENFTPILMLTARNRPEDVLHGFEAGADDYLPKPFELQIFMARLNGLLRRREWFKKETKSPNENEIFEINNRLIDFSNLELRSETETIHLTLMEAKLLRYLIENAGTAVSRKTILEEVWDLSEETDTRAIDNFIVRLRRYLEDAPETPKILLTVRGVGYRFINQNETN